MRKHWLKLSLMLAIATLFSITTALAGRFDAGDVFGSAIASTGDFYVTDFDSNAASKFDSGTNTQPANLDAVTLRESDAYALRILSDGTVLVADSSEAVRLDAAGNIIRAYSTGGSVGGLFSLNLDSNGTSFWTGEFGNGELWKVNSASGIIEQTINPGCGAGCLSAVSVSGESDQATRDPEPSQLGTSLALIGLLAVLGYRRKRAKQKAAENV